MPALSATDKILETGAFANLVATIENVTKIVGLVTNFTFDEDFQVTEAQVIGFFGPISLDAQNYRCNLNFGTYIAPNPNAPITSPYLDGGETSIVEFLKTRQQISIDGKGAIIDRLDIVNRQKGNVINSFDTVVISANGGQINPNTYITRNLRAMAIERII